MQPGQIIGLDIGQKRTGVARASLAAKLAEPLTVIDTDQLPARLKEIIEQYTPQTIVVGLPRGLENQETQQTTWVRQYVEELKKEFPDIEFCWQDEALTTVSAETGQAKNTTDVDAAAASIILQDFLDTQIRGDEDAKKEE